MVAPMKPRAGTLGVFQRIRPVLAAGPAGLLLWFAAVGACAATGEPKRLLILDSFGRDFAPWNTITPAFKTELAQQSPAPIEFHEAGLETARLGEPQAEVAFAEYLRALYARRKPDLVVPVGGPAAQFWWRHRDALFPTTPVVIAGIDQRVLQTVTLTSNDTAVVTQRDLPSLIEIILQVLPETTNIAVVVGDSPLERFWVAECRRAWQPFTNRVQFVWFNDLSFEQMRRRAAHLPPRSAVGYGMLFVDAAGVPHEQTETLDRLCAEANAPVFGLFEEQLGHGIIGGRLFPVASLGREAAHIAARILAGEQPGHIPATVVGDGSPMFDWRELHEWGISESRLPPGSGVRFRRLSVWERYRWYIAGALALIAGQSLTITALLMHRARRRRAEAELREGAQFTELAVNAGELGLWVRDGSDGELRANPRLRALLGLASDGPIRVEDVLARIHADDRASVESVLQRALAEGRGFELEGRLLLPGGAERWVAVKGMATHDDKGRILRTEGVVFDITARKEVEERPRLMLEAAPYAMIMVDQQGTMTLVNAAAETIFGYVRDELLGQRVDLLVPEPHRARHAEHCQSFWAHGNARLMRGQELFAQRKDGTKVPVEIRLNPVATAQGRFVLASILDLTVRREAELAAQRHRNELAHAGRVHALGQLSSALAHELNQPLSAILSNAQAAQRFLAGDAPDLEEIRGALQDIAADGNRASELIRGMRAWVQRGQIELSPLDLDAVIRDVAALLHSDAVIRNITVALELEPRLQPVRGDKIQLQQVVLNLLLNAFEAVKDTDDHDRYVTVRSLNVNSQAVRVAVSDRGTGISRDKLDKLFEPFRTTKPQGLGLGLTISRSIIEAHGGRLWGENNPGRGATFYLELPVHHDPTGVTRQT